MIVCHCRLQHGQPIARGRREGRWDGLRSLGYSPQGIRVTAASVCMAVKCSVTSRIVAITIIRLSIVYRNIIIMIEALLAAWHCAILGVVVSAATPRGVSLRLTQLKSSSRAAPVLPGRAAAALLWGGAMPHNDIVTPQQLQGVSPNIPIIPVF